MLKRLKLRLLGLFRRRRMEAELDEELRYHLERVSERHITSGMESLDRIVSGFTGFYDPVNPDKNPVNPVYFPFSLMRQRR